ncbi:Ig-like domain-containing protein, partial [Candidatus Cloacimonadota bacterium]
NMVAFDTRELRLVDGLYYFRAVPWTPEFDSRGAQLAEYQIDNTPPTLLLDIVANDEEMPTFSYYHDSVDLVTDVDDLLVYPADFLMVEYQYSVEAPGTEFRQWFTFAASNVTPGDYGTTLNLNNQTQHPMYDNIDNDGDGLVDEADEANAYFYIRTWSHDPAGNFSYSNEETILVDGSEPYLHITTINGQPQSGPNWVVDIPADGLIELVAADITPDYLDDAVLADFYYRPTHGGDYILIEEGVDVIEGIATCIWDINIPEDEREPGIALAEGYYTLMVIGWDRVMNETNQSNPLFVETTFILNDATGPEAYITSVGGRPLVEGDSFFANEGNYDGNVTVMITNPDDVATVTLEYSIDGVVYHNIDTVPYNGGVREDYVIFPWTLPSEDDDTYYLRAFVEDFETNDNVPEVMFYYDNTLPMLAVDAMITTLIDIEVWDGELVESVLDYRADSVRTTLEYSADEFHGLIDIASVDVNLVPIGSRPITDYDLGANTYDLIGTAGDNFVFDMNDGNAVSDEYELEIILTDFAGNTETYYFYYIVIDNTAPDFNDVLDHVEGMYQTDGYAVSDGNAIDFIFPTGEEERYINWWDTGVQPGNDMFLGVETVEMRLFADDLEDFVEGVMDTLGNIYFSWIPDALADYLYETISIEITMTDFYGNSTTATSSQTIELWDTEVSKARILEVQDNMVDWQDETQPDVWVTGHWADIDAYVPLSVDEVENVVFEWFDPELEDWVVLGVDDEPVIVMNPPYEYPNSELFVWNWDMTELENGTHMIKATAYDMAGLPDDDPWIVYVYKNDMQDFPMAVVDGTELVRGNYYNLTAASDYPEAIVELGFWYRYYDEEGEWPMDEWFYIGNDDDGEVPYYLNNWLIANNMVPGLEIQIVAVADYIGGGRFEHPGPQDIFDMDLFVQLPIVDVTPPEILEIGFYNGEEVGDRDMISMWINNSVTTMIDTIRAMIASEYFDLEGEYIEDMTDLHRIFLTYTDAEDRTTHLLEELWLNEEDAGDNPYEYNYTNYDSGWDISEFDNGEYSIDMQVWDTADNMSEVSIPFYIDTVAPFSELTITDLDGNDVPYLEREETYILHANATDNMEIATYEYSYVNNGFRVPIDIDGDAETTEFTVPADVEYGDELEFTVVVTDHVGLTHDSSVAKRVFDPETLEMLITQVGGLPYVPNMHINGEVGLDILLLGNEEPDLVTNVALKFRYTGGTDWMLIDEDDPVVPVTGTNSDAAYDVWDVEDLDEGWVQVGVVPVSDPENIWEEPLYWATLYIDHTAPDLAMPDMLIPSCFNGDILRIEFAELPADLDHTAVYFEYVVADQADIEEAWASVQGTIEFGFDGGFWFFQMEDIGEQFDNSGVYDFRLSYQDVAIPDANIAKLNEIEEMDAGTLFDNVAPVAFISQIDDVIAPFDEPVEIVLSTTPVFTVMAFEHPDEYPYACGIEMVEFYIEDYLVDVVYEEPFTTNVWNTTGWLVGEYELEIVAYDGAGNWTSDSVDLALIPYMEPYAVIVGFDFDFEVENHDKIYAVTRDCQDRETEEVWVEYQSGDEWIPFGVGYWPDDCTDVNGMYLWDIEFNADNLITSAVRAVAYYENTQDELIPSSIKPELAVQYYYTPDQGGIFDLAEGNTNEDVRFFYRDIVHATIQPGERVPFLLGMNEVNDNNDQDTDVALLIPHQLADDPFTFESLTCDTDILEDMDDEFGNTLTMWSASVDPTNGYAINLNRAIIDVHPISGQGGLGTMTSEDGVMDVTIPANGGAGYLYFEPVLEDDYIPVEMPFVPISRQEVIRGDLGQNHSISTFNFYFLDGTAQIDPNVPVYMAWTHGQGNQGGGDRDPWMFSWDEIVPAQFIYDGGEIIGATFEFGIEIGFYTLVQNYDFAPELEYVTVSNEWWNGDDLWTAYDWDYYYYYYDRDSMHVEEGIDFSFRSYVMENDGEYEVDTEAIIDVYLNGIRIVNDGVPDPEYVGMPIEIDPVSGIFHVVLVNQEYLEVHNDGLNHNLEVLVDVLGYTNSTEIEFNVDSTYPLIQNDGGGYIRHEMTIWANIWDPQTDIFTDWIELCLYNPEDWNDPDEYIVVPYPSLDITWDEANGWYHVEYTITLDDLTTVLLDTGDVNEVYAQWWAINNVNIETPIYQGYNVVSYIVDIAPPIVWAISPVGAPLDNDGDGLFNEDPINGVNEDLDFDDWNNNGVQDGMWVSDSTGTYWVGEPSIIDEDPIDFHPDTLLYGQPVVIAIGYEDIPMPIVVGDEECGDCTIYSGASGVDIENIIVTLNGIELTDEMGTVTITEGTWQYAPAEMLIPGHYVVIGSVYDIAGNVGYVSYEFEILGVAPTIAFIEPEAGWWLNPHDASTLQFTVDTMEGCPIAFDGVVVTVHTEDGELILGPSTISPDEYGIYSVVVNAGVIDSDEDAITLGVSASTIFGDTSEAAQPYGVDSVAPSAQFTSPEDGAVFGLTNAIHVIATYSDIEEVGREDSNGPQVSISSMDATRGNGSGINSARLFITPPDGETEIYNGSIDGYVETVIEPANLQVGEYSAMLEVIDNVGNLTNININFSVESPAPSITFLPFNGGWWFNPAHNLEPFSFEVYPGSGVGIAEDGVVVTFYGVPGMEVLQGPQTLAYQEDNLYEVYLGANIPSSYTGVIIEVQATNIFGGSTTSSQTYGIDTGAPMVEFISPDDGAEFGLTSIVNVLVNYSDTSEDLALGRTNTFDISASSVNTRTYGSGILSANLRVIDPLGSVIVNVNAGVDTYSLEAAVTDLMVGTYTATAMVTDKAGNTTIKSIEFHVNENAVGIEFYELGHSGWWFGPELNVPLTFDVMGNVAENGVVVNIYGMPGNVLLQGPQFAYESGDMYSVWVAADVVDYNAIVLEVKATNVSGQMTMANQTYSIDVDAPVVSVESPDDGAEFDVGTIIDIRAYYSDGKSGISDVVLKVDGAMISEEMMEMSLSSLLYSNEFAMGEHNVELIVTDHVMNVTTVTWDFMVTDTNIDLVVSDITLTNNPIDFDAGETLELMVDCNKTAVIELTLYDFAGKEVMTSDADNRGVISWSGKRNGVQIARGVYFARVVVTDGRSRIEEIVKIAVK